MTTFAVVETWIRCLEAAADEPDQLDARRQVREVIESIREWRNLHAGERLPTAVYTDCLRDSFMKWIHYLLILRGEEFRPEGPRQKKRYLAAIDKLIDDGREVLGILDLYAHVLTQYSKSEIKPSGN